LRSPGKKTTVQNPLSLAFKEIPQTKNWARKRGRKKIQTGTGVEARE